MPSTYAHKRFGEQVFAILPTFLQEKITPHKKAFYLGLHGPDILFNYKPLSKNPIKKEGMDIHLTPAKNFFVKAAKKLTQFPDPLSSAEGAYIAGFLCHFCLDDACHGHIYKLEDTGVAHGKIEAEFDKRLLRLDGKKIRGYNPAGHLTHKEGVAKASAFMLDKEEKDLKKAIKTMRTVNNLFVFPFEPLHWLLHLILKIIGLDNKFGSMFLRLKTDKRCVETIDILTKRLSDALAPHRRTYRRILLNA